MARGFLRRKRPDHSLLPTALVRDLFATQELANTWVRDVVARFPRREGRLLTMSVPGGRESATFRNPETARMLRTQVKAILVLRERHQGN
jgi:hypothetical protein